MPDYYHAPALVLTALLLPAFAYLYHRYRDTRTLLWLLGFSFCLAHMALYCRLGLWRLSDTTNYWLAALTQAFSLLGSAMFLGSLSPLSFRIGKVRVLYVIAYMLPILVYSALYTGVFHGQAPHGPAFLIFPALGACTLFVVLRWDYAKGALPFWIAMAACVIFGGTALWLCFRASLYWPLVLADSGNRIVTGLLIVFVYRRWSPGVFLSVFGFCGWALAILEIFPAIAQNPSLDLHLIQVIVLSKVVAALGMILLVLEHELEANKAAQDRERRARLEMEAYSNLILSRRRLADFDRQGSEICDTIVENSRFSQAAFLVAGGSGRFHLSGAAGLPLAVVAALDELASRIPVAGFLAPGSAPSAVEHCQTVYLDFDRWLRPGDDLKRLHFTSVLATPLVGRTTVEGALLLAGMRNAPSCSAEDKQEPLRAHDLLPIEILASRLQSVRNQTMMLEKLIDSEKFAGLGQLASNVTQQLNNPLTVILGYASLLDEIGELDSMERKGVEAILAEARRMRSTLESLSRISRPQNDQLAAVSIAELLDDLEELHRTDFLHRSIEFRLKIAPSLPRALCHAHQLRQAVLHCLHYAAEAVETPAGGPASEQNKTIRLEASTAEGHVQIMVAHSGPGFEDPERAFDPFTSAPNSGSAPSLGLSLCSTILRENNGRVSAVNLEPTGAAIFLELQSA